MTLPRKKSMLNPTTRTNLNRVAQHTPAMARRGHPDPDAQRDG
jgi:hypothetical protein